MHQWVLCLYNFSLMYTPLLMPIIVCHKNLSIESQLPCKLIGARVVQSWQTEVCNKELVLEICLALTFCGGDSHEQQ